MQSTNIAPQSSIQNHEMERDMWHSKYRKLLLKRERENMFFYLDELTL